MLHQMDRFPPIAGTGAKHSRETILEILFISLVVGTPMAFSLSQKPIAQVPAR
jgi:hypothetical protein